MGTFAAVTGMNDLLPGPEGDRVRALLAAFRDAAARYGFGEVRTPLLERAELFERGVGAATDIVDKELFTLADRGGRALALRPEGTAPAARAAIEHGLVGRDRVLRWCYAGPMYRAERPAKGRFREFHQVGAEVYGDPSPAVDAEGIEMAVSFLRGLGLARFAVRVNSLGGPETRAAYGRALFEHFNARRGDLSEEGRARLDRNVLRLLDAKDPRDRAAAEGAPSILAALAPVDARHFEAVQGYLAALGVPFTIDPTLVRGLDYYSRTVFEITDQSGALGAQGALCGGGRYDGLFGALGHPEPVPAFGFAAGVERLLMAAPSDPAPVAFRAAVVAAAGPAEGAVRDAALRLAQRLRAASVRTHLDTRFGSLRSQMRRASDEGAEVVLLLGATELAAGTVTLKRMATGEQQTVTLDLAVESVVTDARWRTRGGA